ncbi:phosphotransferase family protein [Tenggerimyces flavus]|uniref:Phosphotransferase family protein n=1 Tax=Tenggerimyces flavus TaxID=1708749 RepID=A0ABV7YA21_9ACTN|nr:aminoglycoside phosphotransferase family protein [Tenggerimyces flavus]MBM7783579.1 aminoglycoside phosphotransferase (APT) family kinase protein [Tenggerimyces flavus]
MRYQSIDRADDACQRALDAELVEHVCRRAVGADHQVEAITELPWGTYNNAYRVDLRAGPPMVLRIAPERARQYRVEAELMRNEYAVAPYLAGISELVPRIHFADFTHQMIDRDYLLQSFLPGVPAPEAMGQSARPRWASLFHQIGTITRSIHEVAGRAFGPVANARFTSWGAAVVAHFRSVAEDLQDTGHVRDLADEAERLSDVLDEITEPRLLHGDGWTVNFLVDPGSDELTVTGLCDWDRAEWGDPLADWAIQRALLRPGTEREAFWIGYGQPRTVASGIRQEIYRARHLLGLRLDLIRPGRSSGAPTDDEIATNDQEVGEILDRLRST